MKTIHVGGLNPIGRCKTMEEALDKVRDDDIIELHKDLKDISVAIDKNITIKGNGHTVVPSPGCPGFACNVPVVIEDLVFECPGRTNGVIFNRGGRMKNVKTKIKGPVRAMFATVAHTGGNLKINDCEIMMLESFDNPASKLSVVLTEITDYYGGAVYLDNNGACMSKMSAGSTEISCSELTNVCMSGNVSVDHTTFHNFNKVTGSMTMSRCTLKPEEVEKGNWKKEPADGPLKDEDPDMAPFALCIAGGSVEMKETETVSCPFDRVGIFMYAGSLEVTGENGNDPEAKHLLTGGAVAFHNAKDAGYWDIQGARMSSVNSEVNSSVKIKSAMDKLDEMIGLDSVKKQIKTIMNTISMNMKNPQKNFGFSNHMVFAGDPGTGKTTVAKLVAQALFEIGAIPENKCMEMPASRLIKGWVGQTGEHVEKIMQEALGGVLFIDEAYELMVKENQNTFNNDAITVLLRYMEDHRDDLVVIAAGYEKEMREFLASNVGLTRRFQWVKFDDYSVEEMRDIFLLMAKNHDEGFAFTGYQELLDKSFHVLVNYYLSHPDSKGRVTNGGNGGLVRNLFQQTAFVRNNRIAEDPASGELFTEDDLKAGLKEELKKAMNVI